MNKKLFLNYWPILVILLLSILIVWPLFVPGYFTHHDDLQIMRVFEMRKCLEDFQIPCRWVPDMGFGYGFPLYNYYGVLPYYIGAVLSYALGYILAAKVLFFIPLVLGPISMYFLSKELFGKIAGFTAAVLFMFAPYRALDAYVRGDVTESFALSLIPLVFYFFLRLIKNFSKNNFIFASLSLGAFLIIHNIMTMFFLPILIVWIVYWHFILKNKKTIPTILSLALGVGLAAFFLFPAFFEKGLVQTENLIRADLDFRVHFVTFRQLFFDRSWGYGASVLGPKDTISFQIGWPQWFLAASVFIVTLFNIYKKGLKKMSLSILLLVIFCSAVFMTHNKSAFIWEKIHTLWYTQFPWRFLSVIIFSASLLGGLLVSSLKAKWQLMTTLVIISLTVILNFYYFRPEKFYPLTDNEKLSGQLWITQQESAASDYLPKTAILPKELAPTAPQLIKGQASIQEFTNKSNKWTFKANVKTTADINVPVFYFPNWQVMANNTKINVSHNNYLGLISVKLDPGEYLVEGDFTNTPLRTGANLLSLLSALIIFSLIFIKDEKFKKVF